MTRRQEKVWERVPKGSPFLHMETPKRVVQMANGATPMGQVLRHYFDRMIALAENPCEKEARKLYHDLSEYHQDLSIWMQYDSKRVFGTVCIIPVREHARYIFPLIQILSDPKLGLHRVKKCGECGKYFLGRLNQRFCDPEDKTRKSPCAVKWHIRKRAERNKGKLK